MSEGSGGRLASPGRPSGAEPAAGAAHHRAVAAAGGRVAAVLRLAATVAALVAGQTILWRAGAALPPLPLDASGLATSIAEAEPLAVAVSLLRLIALGVGTALLAATAVGALARGCGAARLVVRLDRWTPAGLCRLLDGALGAGLAASIALSALPAVADPGVPRPAVATQPRHPDGRTTTTLRRLPDAPPASVPILRRLPDGEPAAPATPAAAASPAPAPPPARREVVVRPGDSFWRLAERHERARLGRRPTEAEVGACWQQLVAANRHRLAVPGDPDLIFPGQVLIVPCP